MQQGPVGGSAQGFAPSFLANPLPLRWELLKPTILALYLQQGIPLPEVVKIMRDLHSFHAVLVHFSLFPCFLQGTETSLMFYENIV
jgi:hypothetical protein